MGEKTRQFIRRMKEPDLFDAILREGLFYRPIDILRLLDDNDPEVLEIFLSVRKRLKEECSEEGKGGEAERLLGVFDVACRGAGIFRGGGAMVGQLKIVKRAVLKDPEPSEDIQSLIGAFTSQIDANGEVKKPDDKK